MSVSHLERVKRDYLRHIVRCGKCQGGKVCDVKKAFIREFHRMGEPEPRVYDTKY